MPPESYYESNTRIAVDERLCTAIETLGALRKNLQFLPVGFWGTELPKQALETLRSVNALEELGKLARGRFEVAEAEKVMAKWKDRL